MEPYPRGKYDPVQARAYYSRHRLLVVQRALQMLRLSNKFLVNLLLDMYVFKSEERNRPKRAGELLVLITQLGPTAIKSKSRRGRLALSRYLRSVSLTVALFTLASNGPRSPAAVGQALSVRQDLIPQEYAEALSTLQDQVPPFDSALAREILQRELGSERLARLGGGVGAGGRGPVASASIGQVYRSSIDGGSRDVAVKVQRPNVLAEIALDLFIVRDVVAPIYQRLSRTGTDLVGLANEWGRGFIAELDCTSGSCRI
jgi:predicted unusual protein kinase regulating ubiquinone biosynthesis (AarF/ABC1/UbiB family)